MIKITSFGLLKRICIIFGRQRLFSLEDYMMLLHSMNYTFDYDTNYMHFYYGHKLGFRPLKNTVNIVHKGLPNDIKKRYPRNYFLSPPNRCTSI